MIAAPLKSNYSKPELFDYFIPLEKYIFTNKAWYSYKHCQKIYDESFAKNTFCIYPTIILFLTAMELSQKAVTTENEDEDILSLNADIALQPFMAPVNHNSLNASKTYQIVHT